MIWSPSRILNNFLVYREVEKKDPKPAPDQPAFATNHTAYGMPGVLNNNNSSSNLTNKSLLEQKWNKLFANSKTQDYKGNKGYAMANLSLKPFAKP